MLDAHAKNLTSTSAFVTIMHTLDPQWGEGTAAYRCAPPYSDVKVANRTVGDELTRLFRGARRIPSPRLQPVPRAARTPRKFGRYPSFKGHFLSPRVTLAGSPIRNFCIAVRLFSTRSVCDASSSLPRRVSRSACRAALREMTSTLAHELPSGMIASMLEPTPLTEELAETVSSRSEAHHAARLSPQQVHDDRWAAAAVTFMLEVRVPDNMAPTLRTTAAPRNPFSDACHGSGGLQELTSAHSGRTMQIPFAWPVASPQKDCTRLDAQKI
jgi:hypothetical protein